MSLAFDAESHTYRWNGQVVPSVTQLLDRLHTFGMVSAEVLDAAKERGTAVHLLTQFHDENDLDPDTVGEWAGYLDGWRAFMRDCAPEWGGIEFQGYSERCGFAGTMDRYGALTWNRVRGPWTVDVKTGQQPHRVWGMQTAAYRQILTEQVDPKWLLSRRATVQLRANGTYKFLPWDDPTDWPAFQALITLINWSSQ